jgi:hypothetical protein
MALLNILGLAKVSRVKDVAGGTLAKVRAKVVLGLIYML